MPTARPTQEFVPIKEIRDGFVVLKDGSIRAVLLSSSINLLLKSYDEREAVLLQFQNFLNSLDFSIQIVIQSRRYDIRPYLGLLEERHKVEVESLMKIQIREYVDFVRTFTESHNVMQKRFYVVVSYSGGGAGAATLKSMLPPNPFSKAKTPAKKESEGNFEEERSQLEQRVAVVVDGLKRFGVRAVQLGSDELVELFYKVFNPGEGSSVTSESKNSK